MSIISALRRIRHLSLLSLTGIALIPSAQASLLVYEGFNGYTAGQLATQKPNANTIGLNTAVGYYDDGVSLTRTVNYTLTATGLTFGSLATSGNALQFTSGTNVIGADITVTHTGTLWSSYLVNLSSRGGLANDGAAIRVGDKPSDSAGGHFNSWADSRPTNASSIVSTGYGTATLTNPNGTANLALNTTYIIINSFTRVGQSLSAGTPGVSKLWALTEAQYSAFLTAGGTESALDTASVTATATNSLTSGPTMTFSANDSISFVTVTAAGIYDELRFGSNLADVTPTAVPEPAATAAIMGIGCGLLLLRRRQSRTR